MSKTTKIVPTDPERLGNTKQVSPAKKWCFTFNNYNEKDYQILNEYFSSKNDNILIYIIGKEVGEKGTPHLQGYISGKNKFRPSELKLNPKIHWEKCKGSEKQNLDYCMKEGSYVTNAKVVRPVKTIITLKPFQESIVKIINGPVHEGKIHWVYDKKGQCGKTQLLRYLNVNYKIPFAYGGKCADIINLAFNNKDYLETEERPCFLYNFGRETENHKISYNSIEQIADGAIANTKFEANCFVFNQPHVIVLANCLPMFSKLTASRWITYTIFRDKLIPWEEAEEDKVYELSDEE